MAIATYKKIASVTVGSGGAANVTFSNIPSSYNDLIILFSGRGTSANDAEGLRIRFNGDTTVGNYSGRRLYGNGSSAFSDTTTAGWPFGSNGNNTASTFGNAMVYIPNYSGSSNKSFSADGVGENNATVAFAGVAAGLWSNTSIINSVAITPEISSNWAQHTTAVLYGIVRSN